MEPNKILLEDRLEVKVPQSFTERSLSEVDRAKLIDSYFSDPDKSRRGLYVTFDLSHSGKVINNRIYQPWAQEASAANWTNPVPLPIIKNHNQDADPVGRFESVRYVSLENEARAHLGDVGFAEVKAAYDSRDSKEIGRVMNKYKLIGNPEWKGLGKLVARALISDREDVEKFLDGRHMSFSAGGSTNRIQCSKCAHTLRPFDSCEHEPGIPTEDGDFVVMVTNTYSGREGSITPFPADKDANVRHMTFDPHTVADTEDKPAVRASLCTVSVTDAYELCDSEIEAPIEPEVVVKSEDQATASTETVEDLEDICNDTEIDWFTLDLALAGIVSANSRLSDVQRTELKVSSFCGPDRSFPIVDAAYYEAAKLLLSKYRGPGNVAAVLDVVETKAQKLGLVVIDELAKKEAVIKDLASKVESLTQALADSAVVVVAKDKELTTLKESLANAIKHTQETSDKLTEVLKYFSKDNNSEQSDENTSDSLDLLLGWFDTITESSETNDFNALDLTPHPDDIQEVVDPTFQEEVADKKLSLNSLNSFEQSVVTNFRKYLDDYSEGYASNWLLRIKNQGLVSSDFDPTKY
jgi:hypothetical protein